MVPGYEVYCGLLDSGAMDRELCWDQSTIPLGTQAGNELIWTTQDPANKELRHIYFGLGRFGSSRTDDLKARNVLVGEPAFLKASESGQRVHRRKVK